MLGQVLADLDRTGDLTRIELARVWMIEERSVYPYYSDRWPRVDMLVDLLRWCAAHDRPTAAMRIMECLLTDTRLLCVELPRDLDINGDGRIDTNDLLRHAGEAGRNMARLTDDLIRTTADGEVTEDERDAGKAIFVEVILKSMGGMQLLDELALRHARRRAKRCHQPMATGVSQ